MVRRLLGFLARAPLGLLRRGSPRAVTVEVAFRLGDHRNFALGGAALRLVLGRGDRADPEIGTRFVTDREGCAAFTMAAVIDRRWRWVNIGFTPLSLPFQTDHIAIAVEMAQIIPLPEGEISLPWLHTLQIDRFADGTCSSFGIERVYAANAGGRFERLLDLHGGVELPGSPARFFGVGYRSTNFGFHPESAELWRLSLDFARSRPAVRH
jgi:hypothetical protein